MSAEPPDSRGMGWAWKCLNMSDTVWNHKWWTWHCPFSFTDKRKCWEEVGKESGGDVMATGERKVYDSKERRGRDKEGQKRTQDGEFQCETQWTSETDRPRQRSGHFLRGVSLWEQSDRVPGLTPEEEAAADTSSTLPAGRMWCAGIMLHKSTQNGDITASFPGTWTTWWAVSCSGCIPKCPENKPEWI